jgi:hypothetical protein
MPRMDITTSHIKTIATITVIPIKLMWGGGPRLDMDDGIITQTLKHMSHHDLIHTGNGEMHREITASPRKATPLMDSRISINMMIGAIEGALHSPLTVNEVERWIDHHNSSD